MFYKSIRIYIISIHHDQDSGSVFLQTRLILKHLYGGMETNTQKMGHLFVCFVSYDVILIQQNKYRERHGFEIRVAF